MHDVCLTRYLVHCSILGIIEAFHYVYVIYVQNMFALLAFNLVLCIFYYYVDFVNTVSLLVV